MEAKNTKEEPQSREKIVEIEPLFKFKTEPADVKLRNIIIESYKTHAAHSELEVLAEKIKNDLDSQMPKGWIVFAGKHMVGACSYIENTLVDFEGQTMVARTESCTSDNSERIKELKTSVLRRIMKIEYKNVPLIPGYERTENEYLAVRNNLIAMNSMIKDLMSYEHGNRYIKAIKEGLQNINDKASLNIYRNKDIFENISTITSHMAVMSLEKEDRAVAEQFSNVCKKLSHSKKRFNEKLENIRIQLKEKRMQTLDLDKDRKKVKNMRFDLENLLQDKGYNKEIREAEKKEFFDNSKAVCNKLIEFMENTSLSKTLKEISKEYSIYMKESADILKEIN